MKLYKSLLIVSVLFFACANVLVAQDNGKKALTHEQILGNLPEGIVNQVPMVTGWANKNTVTLAERNGRDFKFLNYNIKTGVKTPVENSPREIAPVPEQMKKFQGEAVSKTAKNPVLSPDKSKVAFTDQDNNLCVWDAATSEVKKLTTDGTNVIMNGYASWVYYEEILGRSSRYKAFWWSPDSKTLAFYKFDDSNISMFPIYNSTGKHGFITETRYPKAGDTNPEVKIAFANVDNGNIVWADFDHKLDQYFGIPFWNADGSRSG